MHYPDQSTLLTSGDVETLIDEHILRQDPFVFANLAFAKIQTKIARELRVERNGVFVVGSGSIGLSLNPAKISNRLLKVFDPQSSDIDLAIVSAWHFDEGWRSLREQSSNYLPTRDSSLDDELKHQRKRFFDGVILANKLLGYLPFNADWNPALIRIRQDIALAISSDLDVNVWIYRDYWSLRNYTAEGIRKCRLALNL